MKVWRLGHRKNPCDFTPWHLYAWNHRFDDPEREYRTIYAAKEKETCLREVIADLIPKRTALDEFQKLFGRDPGLDQAVGMVKEEFRREHLLTRAMVVRESGDLVDIESLKTRRLLEQTMAAFLAARKIAHLDVRQLRSKDRDVTRKASRSLYDQGHPGIEFRSHLDCEPCYALFEGRAHLTRADPSYPLTEDFAELIAVCKEFGLRLGP